MRIFHIFPQIVHSVSTDLELLFKFDLCCTLYLHFGIISYVQLALINKIGILCTVLSSWSSVGHLLRVYVGWDGS